MELELQFEEIACHETVGEIVLTQEEAAELTIPEYSPEVSRVVDAAGQVQLREKTAAEGRLDMSGTACLRVLYTSGESSGLRSLTLSLPFRCTAEAPQFRPCSTLWVKSRVVLAEVRPLAARKVYARILLEFAVCGYAPTVRKLCTGAAEEPSLRCRKETASIPLLTEVSEREFAVQQEVTPEEGTEMPEEILREDCRLEVTSVQVLASRLLVRGEAALRFLYRCEDQTLHSYETAVPFSQIIDGVSGGDGAAYEVTPQLCESEVRLARSERGHGLNVSLRGTLLIKAVCRREITWLSDLYSTRYEAAVRRELLTFPTVLQQEKCSAESAEPLEFGGSRPFAYLTEQRCAQTDMGMEGDTPTAHTTLHLRLLYLEDAPVTTERSREISTVLPAAADGIAAECIGSALHYSGSSCDVRSRIDFTLTHEETARVTAVAAAELQEASQREMPSLILRRIVPEESLWDIAKQYRTDETAIRRANHWEGDTPPEGMLLIPKTRG